MISQYLSELDKKYRSNPYSTLKDLQAEHSRLRPLLKDIESTFVEKIKSVPDRSLSTNQPAATRPKLPATLMMKYERWLDLHTKRNRLRGLVAHVTATASSKEAVVALLADGASTATGNNSESKDMVGTLESTLDTTSNVLYRLKREYKDNRELLDSRNRSLLTSGSIPSLEHTLLTLKACTQLEDDKYTKILQQSEALANQLEVARVEVQKLVEIDESRIQHALDPRSAQMETRYWGLLSKLDQLRATVSTLEQQTTQYASRLTADWSRCIKRHSKENETTRSSINVASRNSGHYSWSSSKKERTGPTKPRRCCSALVTR